MTSWKDTNFELKATGVSSSISALPLASFVAWLPKPQCPHSSNVNIAGYSATSLYR